MNGIDFLPVAAKLSSDPASNEAEWRTSAGRSYYALFNHVLETLESIRPLFAQDPSDHTRAVKYLKSMSVRDLKSVGQDLSDLRIVRNQADYEMGSVVSHPQCQLALTKAANAVKKLDGVARPILTGAVMSVARLS